MPSRKPIRQGKKLDGDPLILDPSMLKSIRASRIGGKKNKKEQEDLHRTKKFGSDGN